MKFKSFKRAPVLIAVCVIMVVCLLSLLQWEFFQRLELMTYDMRVRAAAHFPHPVATNLGFVSIEEESIAQVQDRSSLGLGFGLYWPRQVYGRLVQELSLQGAKAVAFDVVFGELRPDHAAVHMADGTFIDSDEFFALQLGAASNVILAATTDLRVPALFATNAIALGDITTDKDPDAILRRAKAFRMYRDWHSAFRQVEAEPEYGIDLRRARIEPGAIILPRKNGEEIRVPVDEENNFEIADFATPEPGTPPKAKAFTSKLVWHMGIVLAAQELGLDLSEAEIDLPHGRITLRGPGGIERTIPVDEDGYFYVDWYIPVSHPALAREPIHFLLAQYKARLDETAEEFATNWHGKLVVVGSNIKGGNDLTDRGGTPLEKDTLLVSKHWNVANSVITGQFIRQAPLAVELALIVFLGALTAWLSWRLRAMDAAGYVALLIVVYVAACFWAYIQHRYWLPLTLPVIGSVILEYVMLVTYRAVFEQREQRRIKSVFARVVSPNVANELLGMKHLRLGGARREVTVLFADVRGFTELTDTSHERAVAFVKERQLTGNAAEHCFDEAAKETLNTVNLYLAMVADMVKKHDGTLDKYIGDCVMAFWGAPTDNSRHSVDCVRAAVDAQRAIFALNQEREAQNKELEAENQVRASAGLPPKPLHTPLSLGTGINTGSVTVGLMGSDAHQFNYTVFGREVNLASRLEGYSGRGRIVISETTYQHLVRHEPELAAICRKLPPADNLKGFRAAVNVYEVPWQVPANETGSEILKPAVAAAQ